jgi:hypothetical protein
MRRLDPLGQAGLHETRDAQRLHFGNRVRKDIERDAKAVRVFP